MIIPIPSLDACRNRETSEIAIIHKAPLFENRLYLGNAAWGKIHRFTEQEFAETGLYIIRRSLESFSRRLCEETSEFEKLGAAGKKRFFSQQQVVGISLHQNGDLWLDPVHHKLRGVSGFSDANERRVITPSTSSDEFLKALAICFNLAD